MSIKRDYEFDDTSTNLALKIATSEPEPIAIPASAAIRAGESLMPSLNIATIALPVLPLRLGAENCSQRILSAFSE
jgi:hypothetical protein